jgi:HSP20 family protein
VSFSKYEPASFLNKMQADLDDYYKLNCRRMAPSLFEHPVSPFSTQWLPRVNLKESKKAYTISVDVPGVDPKDIEVSMDDGCLVIKGERKDEKVEQDENHHLEERRFRMPETADTKKISANEKHGVLKIVIGKTKTKASKPNRIEIKS